MNAIFTDLLIAVIPSTLSAFLAYFLAKRKYNAEVDASEIQNLKDSLEFYKHVVEDNQKQLEKYLKIAEANRDEILRLRESIDKLLAQSCTVSPCKKRKKITSEEAKEYQ